MSSDLQSGQNWIKIGIILDLYSATPKLTQLHHHILEWFLGVIAINQFNLVNMECPSTKVHTELISRGSGGGI